MYNFFINQITEDLYETENIKISGEYKCIYNKIIYKDKTYHIPAHPDIFIILTHMFVLTFDSTIVTISKRDSELETVGKFKNKIMHLKFNKKEDLCALITANNELVLLNEYFELLSIITLPETVVNIEWAEEDVGILLTSGKIQIYNKNLKLRGESENIYSGVIRWRSKYNTFISQSSIGLCFIEPNGLMHGEPLPFKNKVIDLKQITDELLLVVYEENNALYFNLYYFKNYNWKLKIKKKLDNESELLYANEYHILFKSRNKVITYGINRIISESDGFVYVVDGDDLLLTNFNKQIIPPPFFYKKIKLGNIQQITAYKNKVCIVLEEIIIILKDLEIKKTIPIHEEIIGILLIQEDIYIKTMKGIYKIQENELYASNMKMYDYLNRTGFITEEGYLNYNGKYLLDSKNIKEYVKKYVKEYNENSITSFYITEEYCIYTTKNKLIISGLDSSLKGDIYTIENNSKLISVIGPKLILLVPRGNLEILTPKIFIKKEIKKLIDEEKYKEAINLCTIHCISSDIFSGQRINMRKFIDEIDDNESFIRFYTGIFDESKVEIIYDDIRDDYLTCAINNKIKERVEIVEMKKITELLLSMLDLKKHFKSMIYILYLNKRLDLALEISRPNIADGIKYMLTLVSPDDVIREAMGLYDDELVYAVSELVGKDRNEYRDFFKTLDGMEENMKRFTINNYIIRRERALYYLSKTNKLEMERNYIIKNNLFEYSLKLNPEFPREINYYYLLYGEHLTEEKALEIYEKRGMYYEAKHIAYNLGLYEKAYELNKTDEEVEKEEFNKKILNKLIENKKYILAALILCNDLKREDEAIDYFVEGFELSLGYDLFKKKYFGTDKEKSKLKEFKEKCKKATKNKLSELSNLENEYTKYLNRLKDVRERISENITFMSETSFSYSSSRKSKKKSVKLKDRGRYEEEFVVDKINEISLRIKNWGMIASISVMEELGLEYKLMEEAWERVKELVRNNYDWVYEMTERGFDPNRPVIEKIDKL
ncbi:Elongator complex protein 1 [Astathelohania contejeani]|uniref:Elongator complex protein 1 n=1 Tax=Astathelohania contejeani TaxID=164912 RepID=A0ABQ7I2T3_9MICR|nr:Elongator complex protein 1 [Thelohania contejeani]